MNENRGRVLYPEETTREQVRQFSLAFGRPVNTEWAELSVEDRKLLAALLVEETVEYVVKGLGLSLYVSASPTPEEGKDVIEISDVGVPVDPIECIDGLADCNIIVHFNSHWHGFNLDAATAEVNDSNMSKLAADGTPIINGYGQAYVHYYSSTPSFGIEDSGPLFDPSKPIGKILKGPNYRPADLARFVVRSNPSVS